METLKTQLLNAINKADENFNSNQLLELNNTYCEAINNMDNQIFSNDEEFFEMFFPNAGDGLKVAQAVFYGDYNYSHDYVMFNGYGNLQSYDYISVKELCELPEVMAEYIAENFNEFSHLDLFSDIEEA
jgi:hypothetical protein